ncbi:MAG TPA: phosphatidate cytidylyltransferase [Candidatus Binataceae bacterium]|nr:phosphatidate cytidylyltransferase [Candidatus Binataceae bacterium]
MLRTRLLTAIVVLPATIAIVLWASAPAFTVFIAILTAWGLYEIISITHADAVEALAIALIGAGFAAAPMVAGRGGVGWLPPASAALAGLVMLELIVRVARKGADRVARNRWFLFSGALWVGALFPYFAMLRNRPGGVPIIILMLLLVVASDSGAYFAGRSLGRVKLMPRVSPNKTVEGAIGGLAACVVGGLIMRPWLAPAWSWPATVMIAVGVGVLAQFGDLAGSAFKRVAGVKDSGWIFPGHGGLLDRTCSLVFAAAFTYYYSH